MTSGFSLELFKISDSLIIIAQLAGGIAKIKKCATLRSVVLKFVKSIQQRFPFSESIRIKRKMKL